MSDNRQSWLDRDPNEERHKGSYDLDLIKASDAYQQRITQNDGAVKRKYAVCFGYLGDNYQGLQINPGAHTVEQEVERAAFLAGGIQECNFGYLHKIQFTRAARTDAGVHAVTQCCAMKLSANPNKKEVFIEQINRFLPNDIRALTMTRVSKGFNAKQHCTKRRYHYLLPTYTLLAASEMNELLKTQYDLQGPVVNAGRQGGYVEENTRRSVGPAGLQEVYNKVKSHRSTGEQIATLRAALKSYEGTRAYHNFTTGKHPEDANAKRFIISFEAGEPFVDEGTGVEWVLLTVLGQSFLLNQIRKMVAMAVEVARGAATLSTIMDAFTNRKMDLPMAPALGLYLGELFFDGYNKKQRQQMENDLRLAKKRAEAKGKVWPPPAAPAQAPAVTTAPAADVVVVADVAADGDAGDHPAKKVRLNPSDEVETTAAAEAGTTSSGSNSSNSATDGATKPAAAIVAVEKDDEGQCHEEIAWSTDPETLRVTQAFREGTIHQHIYQQDGKTLDFLYYFDYLRAYPHVYSEMTKPYGPPGGK